MPQTERTYAAEYVAIEVAELIEKSAEKYDWNAREIQEILNDAKERLLEAE